MRERSAAMIDLYRTMVRIRLFETEVRRLHLAGRIPGLIHLCLGQEAVAAGVCAALGQRDYIASHHRGHGHCIGKGADVSQLFAELAGRCSILGQGRGGSLHVYDPANGNLGTNGIVGGGVPLATGAALSASLQRDGRVAVTFFGDGALNQGLVFECFNLAALWSLPVIFVCENNHYGEFTAIESVAAGTDLKRRAAVFGITTLDVDGMDPLSVSEAVGPAVQRARDGKGPTFLLCETYRFSGHYVGDQQQYKSREERQHWDARDPIKRFALRLTGEFHIAAEALRAIDEAAQVEIHAASARGMEISFPDRDTLDADLYAG
jgi:TPP-dependent pyruvate/acetoin dehydrogenase alpha subunit